MLHPHSRKSPSDTMNFGHVVPQANASGLYVSTLSIHCDVKIREFWQYLVHPRTAETSLLLLLKRHYDKNWIPLGLPSARHCLGHAYVLAQEAMLEEEVLGIVGVLELLAQGWHHGHALDERIRDA